MIMLYSPQQPLIPLNQLVRVIVVIISYSGCNPKVVNNMRGLKVRKKTEFAIFNLVIVG